MTVVYDIETCASIFTYTAINKDTKEIYQYVLHKDKFELNELVSHLKQCKGQVGFNSVNFDYPVIHYLLELVDTWGIYNFNSEHNKIDFITSLYEKAQEIINTQDTDEFYKTVAIPQKEWKIQQLDLFKLWHYNNKARSTSLKALEISMNFPNVMEMPIEHTRVDITIDEIPGILEYNLNDVFATFEFYKKSLDKVNLRKSLQKEYNIPCLNWSDSKIGEQLILKLYCDLTGKDIWEVKKQRTYRNEINFKDCILPYIQFESQEFSHLLQYFLSKKIKETKGSIEKSVIYKGFKYDYGTGGIHGCIKPGIYKSDENYIIMDADVGSLYPNLAIQNNFFIKHLGQDFINVYKNIIDLRMKAKKEGNMVLSDGFKLAANSCYGKSNDINSFLYDPQFTMCITLNGQLLLTMLAEKIANFINGEILQINNDGITVRMHREDIDGYFRICDEWEKLTNLSLEFVEYNKMVIRDVNYGVLTC